MTTLFTLCLQEILANGDMLEFAFNDVNFPAPLKEVLYSFFKENFGYIEYFWWKFQDGTQMCCECGLAATDSNLGLFLNEGGTYKGSYDWAYKFNLPNDKCDICANPLYKWVHTEVPV